MNHREQAPHAQGVYSTHDTSRMGTPRVTQQENTRIIAEE